MLSNPASDPATVVDAAFDAIDTALKNLRDNGFDTLTTARERITALDRLETFARTVPSLGHTLIAALATDWIPGELGDNRLADTLADQLHITPTDARHRVRTAEQLAPRITLTGEQLDPIYPAIADAQADGAISDAHVQIIREFFNQLPHDTDLDTREHAERTLAHQARTLRPDQLRKVSERLLAYLNPDGHFDDADRARKRSFMFGKQGPDLMTKGDFVIDPELRAYLETILAKYARRGMCNPDDTESAVDADPTETAAARDRRNPGQRNHDALKAVLRATLATGNLGQHRGLPVTVVASMTVKELTDATGTATTAGDTVLPMRDILKMARHAYHYLTIFDDDGRPIYLGRTVRIASGDQRIVCYAKDRGCTFPGCWRPANLCQCHHCREWAAQHGHTDVDQLALACDSHHQLAGLTDKHWHTITAPPGHSHAGRILWIPPAHVDPQRKPRINYYHHPGDYLMDDEPLR
ncbi:HNH endonuclease [Antrihabitans sp. YC3-6]|uniref:HNH endonuclease n=1 Tax=Antrihabitans stalagmiti TaxID=2799499 RepID=A0A934NWT4_9NOCA|nr:HNH endonuclease signature motif containing protein [Antrihabitans stalagmiti]MBJ8342846.1 HNH endonuclease [Antrihabitans stalagmiti]